MTFGEFLKSQREAKQWKQPEAAQQIEIEQSYLSKLENNKAIPSPEIFERLISVYGFTIKQVSEAVHSNELEKLKDIVMIREFIISTKKRSETERRRLLVFGVVMSMIGAFLLALGIAMKDHRSRTFQYESKGVIKSGESQFLFAEMPEYQQFIRDMEIESRRKSLQKRALFSRLDYKFESFDKHLGAFYDKPSEQGVRRYNFAGSSSKQEPLPFYLGISFGFMFLIGGVSLFYVSRRW